MAVNVEQTVQAEKIAQLNELLAQPAATCPHVNARAYMHPILFDGAPPTPTPARPSNQRQHPGKLGYPSEGIPPLRIVAFNLTQVNILAEHGDQPNHTVFRNYPKELSCSGLRD